VELKQLQLLPQQPPRVVPGSRNQIQEHEHSNESNHAAANVRPRTPFASRRLATRSQPTQAPHMISRSIDSSRWVVSSWPNSTKLKAKSSRGDGSRAHCAEERSAPISITWRNAGYCSEMIDLGEKVSDADVRACPPRGLETRSNVSSSKSRRLTLGQDEGHVPGRGVWVTPRRPRCCLFSRLLRVLPPPVSDRWGRGPGFWLG